MHGTIKQVPSAPTGFAEWTKGRLVACLATNSGSVPLPFQQWRHFKEAFAPELVARAVRESRRQVVRCLDPFGGCGTTALACQFLGVHPVTIEVNPYLADLIEAKLCTYDALRLARDLGAVARRIERSGDCEKLLKYAPPTFLEPGQNGRWVFDREIACRVAAFVEAIDTLDDYQHSRLFRVLLGGILVDISNVVVNGKGRRYRRPGRRRMSADDVDRLFFATTRAAICEIERFAARPCTSYEIVVGDARARLQEVDPIDLALFSPPYPNSFDYTDVYNLELWTLGYLDSADTNRRLRLSTLCSHVQLQRDFPDCPAKSPCLERTLSMLDEVRARLWSSWIPEMVRGYFGDLFRVLYEIAPRLRPSGSAWIVVGASSYAGVRINTADILAELAPAAGYSVLRFEPFRSMRASPQQGGHHALPETLLELRVSAACCAV